MSLHPDQYPCTLCIAHFDNQADRADHLETYHDSLLPWLCQECPGASASEQDLANHVAHAHPYSVKNGEKGGYSCKHAGCGPPLSSAGMVSRHHKHDHLEQHGLSHRGCLKPGCMFTNDSYIGISLHLLHEHGPKCMACGRRFEKIVQVVEHQKGTATEEGCTAAKAMKAASSRSNGNGMKGNAMSEGGAETESTETRGHMPASIQPRVTYRGIVPPSAAPTLASLVRELGDQFWQTSSDSNDSPEQMPDYTPEPPIDESVPSTEDVPQSGQPQASQNIVPSEQSGDGASHNHVNFFSFHATEQCPARIRDDDEKDFLSTFYRANSKYPATPSESATSPSAGAKQVQTSFDNKQSEASQPFLAQGGGNSHPVGEHYAAPALSPRDEGYFDYTLPQGPSQDDIDNEYPTPSSTAHEADGGANTSSTPGLSCSPAADSSYSASLHSFSHGPQVYANAPSMMTTLAHQPSLNAHPTIAPAGMFVPSAAATSLPHGHPGPAGAGNPSSSNNSQFAPTSIFKADPPLPASVYALGYTDSDFDPKTYYQSTMSKKNSYKDYPSDLHDKHIFAGDPRYIAQVNILRLATRYSNVDILHNVNKGRPITVTIDGKPKTVLKNVQVVEGRIKAALTKHAKKNKITDDEAWNWLAAQRAANGIAMKTKKRPREDDSTSASPSSSTTTQGDRSIATPLKRRKTSESTTTRPALRQDVHGLIGSMLHTHFFQPTNSYAVAPQATAVSTPAINTPAVDTRVVNTPVISTLLTNTPATSTPATSIPVIDTSAITTPSTDTPPMNTLAVPNAPAALANSDGDMAEQILDFLTRDLEDAGM